MGHMIMTPPKSQEIMIMLCVQSFPIPCDPTNCRTSGSSVYGIFQARILEWVAIFSFRRFSQPRDRIFTSPPVSPALQADSLRLEPLDKPPNARDPDSSPGLGRSFGKGHGNPFQNSCLENSMEKGAWQATVHVDSKSQKVSDSLSCKQIDQITLHQCLNSLF